MYEYHCRVIRVIDGESLKLEVDCGFDVRTWINARVMGVNAPEIRGDERDLGKAAREWLTWVLVGGSDADSPMIFRSHKRDQHGRWIGDIAMDPRRVDYHRLYPKDFGSDGYLGQIRLSVSLRDWMSETGIGIGWDGRGTRPGFKDVTLEDYASGFGVPADELLHLTEHSNAVGQRRWCEEVAASVEGRA